MKKKKELRKGNKNLTEERFFCKKFKRFCFTKFQTIRPFGNAINNRVITMNPANDEQEWLAKKIR